jgi:glyoxylate/hydroxypyruvate reductase A
VDALLKLRCRQAPRVVRLDDAGMSVQMAEFVCHAIIRTFRELDGYEADVAAGQVVYRKPRLRGRLSGGHHGPGCAGRARGPRRGAV